MKKERSLLKTGCWRGDDDKRNLGGRGVRKTERKELVVYCVVAF